MKRKQAFAFQYSATALPKGLLSWLPQTPLIEHLFLVLLALLDGPWSEKRCNILHQPPSIELSDSQIALWKKSEAILPEDERLELHSNVDLSAGVSAVEARLKQIDGIEGVTHVYFPCK
jgi:hypothetical protein